MFKTKPFIYLSFGTAVLCCLFYVIAAIQQYSDYDYVHDYLKANQSSDSVGIPIVGSMIASFFFLTFHIVYHSQYFAFKAKIKSAHIGIRIYSSFKKNEIVSSLFQLAFLLIVCEFVWEYYSYFYKFYFYDFISNVFLVLTCFFYSQTVADLIFLRRTVKLDEADKLLNHNPE